MPQKIIVAAENACSCCCGGVITDGASRQTNLVRSVWSLDKNPRSWSILSSTKRIYVSRGSLGSSNNTTINRRMD
jgi:hypothetical protein